MTDKEQAHDIELPPLPSLWIVPSVEAVDHPGVAKALMDYARAAVEADRKRRREPVKVNAIFEMEDSELIGTTEAKIKRVEHQDDGSLTVVIDNWPQPTPQQADKVRELEKDAARYRWLCKNKFVNWSQIVGFYFDADTGIDQAIDEAMKGE